MVVFSSLRGLGDGGGSLQSGLSFLSDTSQEFLDLSDGPAGIETLGTGLGAVHDGVTSANRRHNKVRSGKVRSGPTCTH